MTADFTMGENPDAPEGDFYVHLLVPDEEFPSFLSELSKATREVGEVAGHCEAMLLWTWGEPRLNATLVTVPFMVCDWNDDAFVVAGLRRGYDFSGVLKHRID